MTNHPANLINYSSKLDTRKRVKDIHSSDLSVSVSEIARRVSVSRQRVYQILNSEGFRTNRPSNKHLYKCPECGTISTRRFCSKQCKKKWLQIPVICSGCGKLFFRNQARLLSEYRYHNGALFCDKQCLGQWLSRQYHR